MGVNKVPEKVKNIFRSVLTSEGLDAALVAVSGYFEAEALRTAGDLLVEEADRSEELISSLGDEETLKVLQEKNPLQRIIGNYLRTKAKDKWPDGD